jgi:accessory gene regulator B
MKTDMLTEEEKYEIIKYGKKRFRVSALFLLYIVFTGFVLGVLFEGLLFWLSFCLMRRYAGGYHANTQRKCCVISAGVIILVFLFLKYIQVDILVVGLLQGIGYIAIVLTAPVDNKNRILNNAEKKDFRKKTYTVATILLVVSGYLYWKKYVCMLMPISMAYIILALLLIAGKCKNTTEKRLGK